MIQSNELRIGNIIESNGHFIKVGLKVMENIMYGNNTGFSHGYSPIPLTEEILLKCGFKIRKDGKLYHDTLSLYEADFIFNSKSGIIKNLHQLQNLYFALTGQELEVTI